MSMLTRWGLLLLLYGLAGCATQTLPPVTEYTLSPELKPDSVSAQHLPLTIKLAPVAGSQIYATPDIYYVDDGYQRNPYAYSRWVDAPVRMLELVLQDGLVQSRLFKAVLPSSSALQTDLRLETTLYDFYHHVGEGGESEAVVRLGFYLIDAKKGKLLGSRRFSSRVPAASTNAQGGVAAINAAVAQMLPRLVSWLDASIGDER
ncbi:ABC-type transport auxiliary lipoprotein family protein [Thiolapillus sp.]